VPRTGLVVSEAPSIHLDADRVSRLHPGLTLAHVTPEEARAALAPGSTAPGAGERAATGRAAYDLVCFDGVSPDELPAVRAQLYVDALPPGSGLVDLGTMEHPIVVDWDHTHPTMARCQFDDLLVLEARRLGGTERSRVLLESTGGPLALLTPVGGREVVVVAFAPDRSNLPLKLAWPLFLANTLDFLLAGVQREGEEPVLPCGRPLRLTEHEGSGGAAVRLPSGDTVTVEPDAAGRLVFAGGDQTGVYEVTGADGRTSLHAFALLSSDEVDVAPRDELVVGGEAVAADPSSLGRRLLLRDALLLAALGLLVLEWSVWCARR
jgi:hypothetical protein